MGKTVYSTAASLDGFIADDHHSLDWLHDVDAGGDSGEFAAFLARVGAMAMGASTYAWLLAHPDFQDDPSEAWKRAHGEIPCWVFTHRDVAPLTGTRVQVVTGDVAPVHAAMAAAADGRDIWVAGGGDLAGQFADAGLLDEVVVTVAPVTLGAGAPLLPRRLDASRLELTGVERKGQFAELTYAVRRG